MTPAGPLVRAATPADGAAVARVMNGVIAEGGLTALDEPVSAASEAAFVAGLGLRGSMHVAEVDGVVRAFQTFEPFDAFARTLRHVGVAGTQVEAGWRGRGLGSRLWAATAAWARAHGYEKAVIGVRAGNARALAFYRGLGFCDVGVARRQVRVDGRYEDQAWLEAFLDEPDEPAGVEVRTAPGRPAPR